MFGDDSRLSHLVKRVTKESERDRRLTAAQQLEEFLSSPDNYQVIVSGKLVFCNNKRQLLFYNVINTLLTKLKFK